MFLAIPLSSDTSQISSSILNFIILAMHIIYPIHL